MKQGKIIIYQLLPRLFGNTNEKCIPNGSLKENGVGKFKDITDRALREIARLGSTHVWYTGVIEHATQTDYSTYGIAVDNRYVVKGKAGSPYAIKDYYDIDPDLAVNISERMAEFEALVERTHRNKLKVLIDFVPNHVARQYHSDAKPSGVKDLGADDNPEHAFDPHNNFYYLPQQPFSPHFYIGEGAERYNEFPAKATGNDCFSASPGENDWYETVKLNYGVDYLNCMRRNFDPIPDTWIKMRDILLFWAGKNIDGFRCDMAEMVPVEFWGWAIPQIKQHHPDIIFIAAPGCGTMIRYNKTKPFSPRKTDDDAEALCACSIRTLFVRCLSFRFRNTLNIPPVRRHQKGRRSICTAETAEAPFIKATASVPVAACRPARGQTTAGTAAAPPTARPPSASTAGGRSAALPSRGPIKRRITDPETQATTPVITRGRCRAERRIPVSRSSPSWLQGFSEFFSAYSASTTSIWGILAKRSFSSSWGQSAFFCAGSAPAFPHCGALSRGF